MRTLLALSFAICGWGVGAQDYAYVSATAATNEVQGQITNTFNLVLPAQKLKELPVLLQWNLTGAGDSNQTFVFQRSVDGTNWETLAAKKTLVTHAANGTNPVTLTTNISTHGAGYIRLAAWGNDMTNFSATNLVVRYGVKVGAP